MTVTVHETPDTGKTTELHGTLPDQAALMGVLERLDSYGARLLGMQCLDAGDVDESAPGPIAYRWP